MTSERIYKGDNAPRSLRDYLMYPRVLFTSILCLLVLIMHIAFGLYVWIFQK
jgi:hypothetical protein